VLQNFPAGEFFIILDKQQYRFFVIIVMGALTSVYFFIFSQSGLLERINLEKENTLIQQKIEKLKGEKLYLQDILRRYKEGKYPDSDILESGYMRPGERIIFFQGIKQKYQHRGKENNTDGEFGIRLPYLRIIWLVISAAVFLGLVLYGRSSKTDEPLNIDS
jgi:hypothetical protein